MPFSRGPGVPNESLEVAISRPLGLRLAVSAALLTALAALGGASATQAASRGPSAFSRAAVQTTLLISRAQGPADAPNGPSTNAVISNDKRYARVIAFESEASNLVSGDTNGVKDIFAVRRARPVGNIGTPWRPGRTFLVSRTRTGQPANGPSFSPAVGGAFHRKPSCVAFLSAASNIVPGDTNGKVDAFVSRGPGRRPIRISLPYGGQSSADTTSVAVSGGCSRIAFVTGGTLYVRRGRSARQVRALAHNASDPSFSRGLRNDLVFAAPGGVYLSKGGTRRPRLVGPGGRNPAYNDIKRQVVVYEKTVDGHTQVVFRDLGKREAMASARGRQVGNGDSRNPSIGNSGYYITFESDASNLGVNALRRVGDFNSRPDVYLYTNVRDMTLVQSVEEKAVPLPGGGVNPSMSFYANYIVFDAPAPLGNADGPRQVYMRYLGPV
jgi:hypothetical protein